MNLQTAEAASNQQNCLQRFVSVIVELATSSSNCFSNTKKRKADNKGQDVIQRAALRCLTICHTRQCPGHWNWLSCDTQPDVKWQGATSFLPSPWGWPVQSPQEGVHHLERAKVRLRAMSVLSNQTSKPGPRHSNAREHGPILKADRIVVRTGSEGAMPFMGDWPGASILY